ncbi:MAG: nucleoside-diphosphate sugar epimerase/dehydratase [Planctomycetota bacterium]
MPGEWALQLRARQILLFLADMGAISLAYFFAYWLRLDVSKIGFAQYSGTFWNTLPWLLTIRFLCGILVRQYTWSFLLASLSEAVSLAKAALIGSILFVFLTRWGGIVTLAPPRSVYALEFLMSLLVMAFLRFFPRYAYQQYTRRATRLSVNGEVLLRTLIYGAGHTGELILRDLLRTRVYPYRIIGFVDDDPAKWSTSIHGYRVLGPASNLGQLIERHRINKILVAIPNLSPAHMRELVDVCGNHHIRFKIVPGYADIVSKGGAAPLTLKDLQLEDLLERSPVVFDQTRMAEFLLGRTVLVTGAAGSIGSEICRQVIRHGVKRLVALDINENDSYFLQLDLREAAPAADLCLEIASVRDANQVADLFDRYRPAIVFHAAAHKHVPLIEACPAEALKNNVLGTLNVARAADRFRAERFVLISTDKAVRPTSVMGASKYLSEGVVRSIARASRTRFMAVRFGNVLGSNGSLVPILQRQIARGGPVTITHPKVTRFFMTIPEAVGLVLIAALQNEGELSVLDMGEPLSVDRLARQMISLAGLIPDEDIPIVYTGLRPGEKMYEELFMPNERRRPSSHPRIFLSSGPEETLDIEEMLSAMEEALAKNSPEAVRSFLSRFVADYQPNGEVPSSGSFALPNPGGAEHLDTAAPQPADARRDS